MKRITKMTIRGTDRWGEGRFGAPRGGRAHHGVDLKCEKGDTILSPVDGVVTKIGYPYAPNGPKGHYRYVEVKDHDDKLHRVFYIHPLVEVGQAVVAGAMLGRAQGLQETYPGITDHVHYEIKLPGGGYEDPTPLVS